MAKDLLNLAERTVMTYLQALVALLVVGDATHASTYQSALIAAIPAGLTVLANGLPIVPTGLSFLEDLVFRTVRTYVATFIGLVLAVPVFRIDVTFWRAAAIGAIPAALAVVKAGIAHQVGDPNSAALLPSPTSPAPANDQAGMTTVELLLVIIIILIVAALFVGRPWT